ncbi:hypothetical protein GQ457_08G027600 [Hibiscus cannabinus]
MRYDKSKVECYSCQKLGHFSWECQNEGNNEEMVNLIEDQQDVEEPTLLLALKNEENNDASTWYLDNGARNHMCGDKEAFVKLDEKVKGNVSFGDSSKVQIQGKGTILISLKDDSHSLITDVYYVPKLKSNILSLGQLLEKGYEIHMKDRCLWLRNQYANLIAKVSMSKNRMFMLNLKMINAKCLKASVENEPWCWHMRFGHLNFGALKMLGEKKMVNGIPAISHPNQLCEACLLGKHARSSFPKEATSRATEPLQLVHTDVCGPIKPPSFGKSRYFLLFIDDYSRKTWVHFLKQKSEAFGAFKNFKALVEKESGFEIKSLRSDRGGEFTSNEFNDFCKANGIHRPLIMPRSPQQNGVAERKNMTILNMARSMLKAKNTPKEFWAEVVSCAVYLSNRSPTKNVDNVTPQEAWSGRKPSVRHIRVFGSIAYAHVPEQEEQDVTPSQVVDLPQNMTPLPSPAPIHEETSEESSSSGESSSERPPKFRSVRDLYRSTEAINDLLEEKLSNSQSEIQVLRQQSLVISPTGKSLTIRQRTMIVPRTPDNGNVINGETKDMTLAISNNQNLMIKCISQNLGFFGSKLIADCVIYKCLFHWRSFKVEKTNVFDHIIQVIASFIEVQDNNDFLTYWLSNSSTLLMLLQHTLKYEGMILYNGKLYITISVCLINFLFLLSRNYVDLPKVSGVEEGLDCTSQQVNNRSDKIGSRVKPIICQVGLGFRFRSGSDATVTGPIRFRVNISQLQIRFESLQPWVKPGSDSIRFQSGFQYLINIFLKELIVQNKLKVKTLDFPTVWKS